MEPVDCPFTASFLLATLDIGEILAEHISPLRERLASMLETSQDAAADIVRRIRNLSALPPGTAPPNTSRRSPRPS
ncbi:MAG: hypothetical protein NOF05_01045 [Candidatus Accumulibacter phosphatis]|uniref:Uncharacterized protein n=1 Tax=Candidatus Accumulibacter cognatus TaxID=2954383 RepID=A0A080M3U4_9PROT|nr:MULTISPECIES: hypothetical protein [Candidatus Accumulibacter]MCC2866832.1 hypothetical protein [Candidatus Accumulibacter phosphatis]KFB75726.1 MAG: hypothetical protein AW06_003193 [Candidatus Accumulibacter cognatus]MBN8516460.1 hypothetical protein [Accumulibacter sp.]MBO3713275.1 hypothetical protein [Accumulibacter sp.]MCQ1547424.1 hypothetical protein [Candidatus Accumulibacter phosphatis]